MQQLQSKLDEQNELDRHNREHCEELKSQLDETKDTYTVLEEKYRQEQQNNNTFAAKIAELESTLRVAREEGATALAQSRAKFDKSARQLAVSKQETQAAQTKYRQLQERYAQIRSKLNDTHSACVARDTTLAAAEEKMTQLAASEKEWHDKYYSLETTNKKLEAEISTSTKAGNEAKEQFRQERNTHETQLRKLQEQTEARVSEISIQLKKQEEMQSVKLLQRDKSLQDLTTERELLRSQNGQLAQEVAALKKAQEVLSLQQERVSQVAREQQMKLERQTTDAQAQVVKVEGQLQALRTELSQMEARLMVMQSERDKARHDLEVQQQLSKQSLDSLVVQHNAKVAALEAKLANQEQVAAQAVSQERAHAERQLTRLEQALEKALKLAFAEARAKDAS
eukprot:TRINITY_DN4664_c0_g1_i2.p1 TRINITY_DN4664_c0_g1~~TRINITY_DN4664_c0_g1_i2.p1  ORF type:complete len:398 (+),score=131.88 TRINITY_DN4664_c0_g1_i2:139-1332(+)